MKVDFIFETNSFFAEKTESFTFYNAVALLHSIIKSLFTSGKSVPFHSKIQYLNVL